jgi:hypothetical protein
MHRSISVKANVRAGRVTAARAAGGNRRVLRGFAA